MVRMSLRAVGSDTAITRLVHIDKCRRMTRFIRASFITFATEGVTFLCGLAYGVITARALGPEGKGTIGVLVGSYWIVVSITSIRFDRAVVYSVAKQSEALSDVIGSILAIGGATIALSGVAYHLAPPSVIRHCFGGVSPDIVAVSLTYLPSTYITQAVASLHSGQLQFGLRLTMFATLGISRVMGAVAGLLVLQLPVRDFVLFSGILELAMACALFVTFLFRHRILPSYNCLGLKRMLWFAIRNYWGAMAELVLLYAPLMILSVGKGSTDAGLYIVAMMVAQTLGYFATAIRVVLLPQVAASNNNFDEKRVLRLLIAVQLLMALGLLAFGYPLIILVYGDAFAGSFVPALLLGPGAISATVLTILTTSISGRGRPGVASLPALTGALVIIFAAFVFEGRFSIYGTALLNSVSYTISALLAVSVYANIAHARVSNMVIANANDIKEVLTFANKNVLAIRSRSQSVSKENKSTP